jgi:hypothetical protein
LRRPGLDVLRPQAANHGVDHTCAACIMPRAADCDCVVFAFVPRTNADPLWTESPGRTSHDSEVRTCGLMRDESRNPTRVGRRRVWVASRLARDS